MGTSHRLRTLGACLFLGLAIPAACGGPPPLPPQPSPVPAHAAPGPADAGSPDADRADAADAAGEPDAAAAPVAAEPEPADADAGPPPFEDRTLVCGNKLCRVDHEVCCGNRWQGTCGPLVVKPTGGTPQELGPQFEACRGETPTFCDDSSDCGPRERCCEEWFTSDRDVTVCKAGGCELHELCVPERPCRTPRTSCVSGVCRGTGARIPCGAVTCQGKTPLCCVDEVHGTRTCGARCESGNAIACTHRADCPPGNWCQGYGGRTWCTGMVDIANASVLCAADSDCPEGLCTWSGGGKPRCPRGKGQDLRTCSCQ